jgi:hypothetical protein
MASVDKGDVRNFLGYGDVRRRAIGSADHDSRQRKLRRTYI